MKRKTCKVLIGIGISLILLSLIFPILYSTSSSSTFVNLFGILTIFGTFFIPVGIVLLIVAWIKWNSERKETERQETRKAQLKALKRGNVSVDLKGKMRKLK